MELLRQSWQSLIPKAARCGCYRHARENVATGRIIFFPAMVVASNRGIRICAFHLRTPPVSNYSYGVSTKWSPLCIARSERERRVAVVPTGTACPCNHFRISFERLYSQRRDLNSTGKEAGKNVPFSERVLRFIGWLSGFYSRKAILTRSSKSLYESCVDTVDYEAFFKACSLPDSFQSWFLVAQLHVWLCLVRLKREGQDGEFVIRNVVSTFWYDVQQRMQVLGVHSSGVAKRSLKELVYEFYGLILAYEEGLLSDDRILAAALWRNLFDDKANTDPTQLACVVEYVRRQVLHMDKMDSKQLLETGEIELLPFKPAAPSRQLATH